MGAQLGEGHGAERGVIARQVFQIVQRGPNRKAEGWWVGAECSSN